ncbi:MAG: PP2C family protein-serine/threonine phosphatase, partial [Candidatus Nanopelagicales bacterium]
AMDSGDPEAAQEIIDSEQAQLAYSDLTAATYRLGTFITNDVNRVLAAGAHDAQQLAWALAAALAVALLAPLVSYFVLRRNVLGPISRLRKQMRAAAAAGRHDTVIEPTGPTELYDLGADAEALRRALVHEIDQANAARGALEQEGPVVDAIRRELEARTDPQPIGVLVAGVLRPAEGMLAGDFWDRIPLADGRTAAVICDVSGHGPRAGIVAMRLKTAVTLGLISGQDVPQVLHRASDTFADEPGRFATMVVLTADPASGELSWVNAGHPAPRVVRVGGAIEHLEPTGPMVSWLGGVWTTGSTRLGPGDVCLAFTDGILESRDASGAELGDAELDQRLRVAAEGTSDPQEVIAHALAGVRHRADDLGRDDVTVVALRLDPREGSLIPTPRR